VLIEIVPPVLVSWYCRVPDSGKRLMAVTLDRDAVQLRESIPLEWQSYSFIPPGTYPWTTEAIEGCRRDGYFVLTK